MPISASVISIAGSAPSESILNVVAVVVAFDHSITMRSRSVCNNVSLVVCSRISCNHVSPKTASGSVYVCL